MKTAVFGVGIDTARYGHHVTFVDQDIRMSVSVAHPERSQRQKHRQPVGLLWNQ